MYGPLQHIYLSAHGEWNTPNWTGEKFQIGLRLPFASVLAGPAKGSIWTPLPNGDVTSDPGTTAGTHGTLAQTWTARVGDLGSTENVGAAEQIDLCEDFWTFLDTVKSYYGSNVRWTHIKVAPIEIDGDYGAPAATYSLSSPLQGTATATCPPSLAIALSLRAPIIGRRGRGRIYMPAINQTAIYSDGTITAGANAALRAAFKTLVDDLQNPAGFTVTQPIVSVMSAGSPDCIRPSEIRCGSHFDVQTRRQDQVPEVYSVTAL